MNPNLAQTQTHGHFAAVNGIQMYYEMHGEGKPLVLLHGMTQSTQLWQPFIELLSEHYTLIIPDLRGHGRSTGPLTQKMAQTGTVDVFALLDQLEIHQCKAIGVSYGSSILLQMAIQQPARMEAMILVGATSYFPAEVRAVFRKTTPESEVWNWSQLRAQHVHGDEQIRSLLAHVHSLKDSSDDMNLTPADLSRIQTKTLIVAGDRDHFFPVSIPTEMYAAIPQSYLWIVPNGDHVPILGERVRRFTQTALDFFAGNWELTQ